MSRKKEKPASEGRSFEESLAELEDVVSKLEAGESPLEESIELYERGVAAFKRCHELLRSAERRIELLVGEGGGELRTVPFEPEGAGGSEAAGEPAGESDEKK